MDKNQVLDKLKKLAKSIRHNKIITQKDVRTIPKLGYYLTLHFRNLGTALREAGLPSSHLASKMAVTNEQLLMYLKDLQKELKRNPRTWDITHDEDLYKKYSQKKFTWRIFKTRFGGFKNALKNLENQIDKRANMGSIENLNEETEKENSEFFQNKTRYYGKAAELHVAAELLYRGFQAANIPIDEGLDILAVKNNKTFYFQVKHKDLNNNESIHVTRSSFERRGGGDVYYIFVLLSDKKRDFVIVPYHIVSDWIRTGLAEEKEKGYTFLIKKNGNEYRLRDVVLNKYLDQWEDIK